MKSTIDEEMSTLHSQHTGELVDSPPDATMVGCRLVYIVKYHPDITMNWYKARLVAKIYTNHGVDYFEIVYFVDQLNFISNLLSIVNSRWHVFQFVFDLHFCMVISLKKLTCSNHLVI